MELGRAGVKSCLESPGPCVLEAERLSRARDQGSLGKKLIRSLDCHLGLLLESHGSAREGRTEREIQVQKAQGHTTEPTALEITTLRGWLRLWGRNTGQDMGWLEG